MPAPRVVRERTCGGEDWLRAIGSVTSTGAPPGAVAVQCSPVSWELQAVDLVRLQVDAQGGTVRRHGPRLGVDH